MARPAKEGPSLRSSPGDGATRGTASGLVVVGAVAVLDALVVDDRMVPITSLVIAPLLSSMHAPPLWTGAVAVIATVASVALAWTDDLYDAGHIALRVAVVAVTGALAVLLARRRQDRERHLSQVDTVRELTTALQRALLPVPAVGSPGVSVSARYVPGERRLLLGGDFFDVVTLPSGHVGFVIGDVVGHGPVPAAMAASLRAGWRTLAATTVAPARWLEALNDLVLGSKPWPGFFVTCLTGTLDPTTGIVRVASAGHPAPILVRGGTPQAVRLEPGPPLGFGLGSHWPTRCFGVASAAMLLYTDGLIEGRREPRGVHRLGEDGLLSWLQDCRSPLDGGTLDRLLAHVQAANGEPLADDIALVAVTTSPTGDPVTETS